MAQGQARASAQDKDKDQGGGGNPEQPKSGGGTQPGDENPQQTGGTPPRDPRQEAGKPLGSQFEAGPGKPVETEEGDALLTRFDDPDDLLQAVEEADTDTMVTLKKDVVEEFYYPDTKRPAYRLLYTKGQTIPRSVLTNRAAEIKAARAARGDESPEEQVRREVDSTTLAAGTAPGNPDAPAAQ